MDKSILEILTDNALNERLNSVLVQDEEYQKIQSEIEESTGKFDGLNLSREQRLIVDRLVSSYTASGCRYGKIAYQEGIKDCAALLVEIGMIRNGKEEGVA